MGEVVRFPVRRVLQGLVKCPPLGIFFPRLYRARVTTSSEQLAAYGMKPGEAPERWVHYALEQEMGSGTLLGDVTWDVVTCIDAADQADSLVIRHHATLESAAGYMDAKADLAAREMGDNGRWEDSDAGSFFVDDDDGSMVYETDDGYFTMIPCNTRQSWPGPLLMHVANIPVGDDVGPWAHIVGPNGELLDSEAFGFLP